MATSNKNSGTNMMIQFILFCIMVFGVIAIKNWTDPDWNSGKMSDQDWHDYTQHLIKENK